MARTDLDDHHDALTVLACAADDVARARALPARRTVIESRDAVDWRLAAARPLRDREVTPSG